MRVTLVLFSLVIGLISAWFVFKDDGDEEGAAEESLLSVDDDGDGDGGSGSEEEEEDSGGSRAHKNAAARAAAAAAREGAACDLPDDASCLLRVQARLVRCKKTLQPKMTWKYIGIVGAAHAAGFVVLPKLWRWAGEFDAALAAASNASASP